MASVFPVIGTWWGGNGARVGDGRLIRKGSSSTPFESAAYTVGDRKWTVEITYSADQDTQIAMRANWFEAGKKTTGKQDFITTWNIRGGANAALRFEFELPTNTYPLWTPSIAVPGTANDITIHNFNVYETPKPGLIVNLSGGRGSEANGFGTYYLLGSRAKVGDLLVVFYASQYGNTKARPPAGWDFKYTSDAGGRSGYIAVKRCAQEDLDKNIKFNSDSPTEARENFILYSIEGVSNYTIHQWQPGIPTLDASKKNLVAVQYHAYSSTKEPVWYPPEAQDITTGGNRATNGPWSLTIGAIANSVKETFGARAYAWVELEESNPEKPTPKTPGVEVVDSGSSNLVFVYQNGEERPATMKAVPRGYTDIGTMMITRGFLIAHRGGSVSWPEASMRAYTNSVMFGVGALEVSCQKTKDGVWFLNHDRTLQRVDKTAPDTPVTEMTWAEIQKFTTMGEPFMTVEEYFAAYASSHITVLDPKYSAVQWEELKKFFPSDAQGRIIWKFSIDAGWLANQWKSDGWKCWGYSYPDHVTDGRINEWHKPWDYVGMTFDASDEVWRRTTALGKPIWAHICPTRQAYDDGLAKGAIGCMVSGVANIYSESLV
nr:MAG TPA: hypothetical protein [Caudoviricetes sp.]